MSPDSESAASNRTNSADRPPVRRRRFLALAGSAGAVALAGCSGDGSADGNGGGNGDDTDGDGGGDTTDSQDVGTFRLLISDQPVAIDEFDSLEVSFDRARVFRSGADEDEDEDDAEAGEEATPTATATATPEGNETAATEATITETPGDDADGEDEEADDDGDEEDGDESGFSVIDLEGATVDLTQVLGKKALGVFEGGLPAGRYTKIELYAASVDGIVDGESVDVKIPSGKLQIVKPFEVEAGSTVSFVFDINVVKKGPKNGYNLLPVISESGVAGEDVEVEEVDEDDDADEDADDDSDEDDSEEDDSDGTATPEDATGAENDENQPSGGSGNQTA